MFGLMSVKKHDRIVAKADAVIDDAAQHLRAEEFSAGRTLGQKVSIAIKRLSEARKTSEDMLARNLELQARVIASDAKLEAAMASLAQIAAQETPTANATVKRMARLAREGIGARNARDQKAAA